MKSLKKFEHIIANAIDDAVSILRQYGDKVSILAGGTDLVGTMRFEVLRDYPDAVINLKTIPRLDYIVSLSLTTYRIVLNCRTNLKVI